MTFIITILLIVLLAILIMRGVFSRQPVSVSFEGPGEILNGEERVFKITYKNNSGQEISNAELNLTVPPNTLRDGNPVGPLIREVIGTMKRKETKVFTFNLAFFEKPSETLKLGAKAIYQPEGTSVLFEVVSEKEIKITGHVVELSFGPATTNASGTFNTSLVITNKAQHPIKDVNLKITYPDNFLLVSANPRLAFGQKNIWQFGELQVASSTTVELTGRILGAQSLSQPFQANLIKTLPSGEFVLGETSSINQIVSSGLIIFQKVNNDRPLSVGWGDVLDYDLSYRNATTNDVADVIIEFAFDPKLVDLAKSNFNGGIIDPSSGTVRFDKFNLRSLERLTAGQEGVLRFSVAIVNLPPQGALIRENFNFKSSAVISGTKTTNGGETPLGQDILDMKLETKVLLASKVYYQSNYFQNIGPLPPRVGNKTTYTVVLEVSNFSNNVSKSSVEAFLGPNISWEGIVAPKNATIRYDATMRKVIWDLGTLRAGTGFNQPLKTVAFQIGLTPTFDQVAQNALLIGQAKFSGVDVFASSSLSVSVEPVYSNLPHDPLNSNKGSVLP